MQLDNIEKKVWIAPQLVVIPFDKTKSGGPNNPPEDTEYDISAST